MADPTAAEGKEPMRIQVLDKLNTLIAAAFGLVAALAWNAAIQEAIAVYIPAGSRLRGLFLYAVAVTAIAVIASIWIGAAFTRARRRMLREQEQRPPRSPPNPVG